MLFTERDLRMFRATALLGAAVVFASLIILIFWILAQVLAHFYSLLLPLSIAGVLALVLDPAVRFISEKLGLNRRGAVILLAAVIALGLVATYFIVLPATIDQSRELANSFPELAADARDSINQRFPGLSERVVEEFEEIELTDVADHSERAFQELGSYAGVIIGLGFVPLFLFFMLLSGDRISHVGKDLLSIFSSEKREETVYLVRLFIEYVTAFFQGQLVIALIMGVLLAIGFSIIDLQAAIVLGLLLGLLNIVPYLGVIVGLAVVVPIAWVQPGGGLQLVGLVLAVFTIVQLLESWLLTPRIMSEKSGLHPAIVVISLFFWGIVFGGIIGMLLAVPLSAFLVALWNHAKARYFSPVLTDEIVLPENSRNQTRSDPDTAG